MAINVSALENTMLGTLKGILIKNASEIEQYAKSEVQNFTQSLGQIESLKLTGAITEEAAKIQIDIQKNSLETVMLTIKGLTTLAVEEAINAAIDAIKSVVNTAIGWSIL